MLELLDFLIIDENLEVGLVVLDTDASPTFLAVHDRHVARVVVLCRLLLFGFWQVPNWLVG